MTLKPQQSEAYSAISDFLDSKDQSVFILKGYAGTGKTTMIKAVLPLISGKGLDPYLVAPTGRAAKILKEKTGHTAFTIHKMIYSHVAYEIKYHDENGNLVTATKTPEALRKSKGVDEFHIYFQINSPIDYQASKSVIIVDESSMISSKESRNEYLHFGTDILINDLLTFANVHKGAKLIFVGDPAQLPPVGDNKSVALDEEFFKEKGLGVASFCLTEIIRQASDSAILTNAMKVRDLLEQDKRNSLVFDVKESEVEPISAEDVIGKYIESQPSPEIGNNIIICYSNAMVKGYNDSVRAVYFPESKGIAPGDVLQVVKNNYKHAEELFNGDFVKVLSVDGPIETHTVPVWVSCAGEKKREQISIEFVKVTIQTEKGTVIRCYVVNSLLNSPVAALSPEQFTALYVDFKIRNPHKPAEVLAASLLEDEFFNALHVKYGYAITCHKAQGGEWGTAFVDYSKRTGLDNDSLRWNYTATTRASKMLFAVNIPNITPFTGMKINPVTAVSNPLVDFAAYADVNCELLPTAEVFRKVKCNAINDKLKEIDCRIESVKPLNYCDRYTITTPDGPVTIDCYYKKQGYFTSYKIVSGCDTMSLLDLIRQSNSSDYKYNYVPTSDSLKKLHSKVVSLCDELQIYITNVILHDWDVVYCLRTSGEFSYIKFFFDKNGNITHASPASDLGAQDTLLNTLMEKLSL